MNPQNQSSPVSSNGLPQGTATLPSSKLPSAVASAAHAVEEPPIPPRLIESEARTAWYHFQAAFGLLAAELERSMTKVYRSVVDTLRSKPGQRRS
jgi:hypothetical protein